MGEHESERLRRIGHGLAAVIGDQIGRAVVYDPDDRLDAILKRARVWDEIDVLDLFIGIWDFFGLPWRRAERADLLGPVDSVEDWEKFAAQEWTLQRIAERIGERLDSIQVNDICVLGKPCRSAGAFLAVEQICQELFGDQARFKPSDSISSRFWGRRLRMLWQRLRWVSNLELPQLCESRITAAARLVMWAKVLLIVGIVLYWLGADDFPRQVSSSGAWNWWIAIGPVAIVCLVLWPAKKLLERIDRRLPAGIETFRDLAVVLSKGRNS